MHDVVRIAMYHEHRHGCARNLDAPVAAIARAHADRSPDDGGRGDARGEVGGNPMRQDSAVGVSNHIHAPCIHSIASRQVIDEGTDEAHIIDCRIQSEPDIPHTWIARTVRRDEKEASRICLGVERRPAHKALTAAATSVKRDDKRHRARGVGMEGKAHGICALDPVPQHAAAFRAL